MRFMPVLLLVVLLSAPAVAQMSATPHTVPGIYIATENASNVAKNITGTAGTDTTASIAYLVGICFNTPVANDTISVVDGSTTVASFSWATAPSIFSMIYNCKISDTLFVTRAATSDLTLIYRIAY